MTITVMMMMMAKKLPFDRGDNDARYEDNDNDDDSRR